MKTKNVNRSSEKTRSVIKKIFAEMLAEKKSLDKITVSELTERADISRGAFYFHYDDIYSVAEDYENEFMNHFFDNARLLSSTTFSEFLDSFFEYIKANDETYKLLCTSDDFIFSANRLSSITANKIFEICNNDKRIKNKEYLKLEIDIFVNGLLNEYIRYCRGISPRTPSDLYDYTKVWGKQFADRRFKEE